MTTGRPTKAEIPEAHIKRVASLMLKALATLQHERGRWELGDADYVGVLDEYVRRRLWVMESRVATLDDAVAVWERAMERWPMRRP